MQQFTGGLFWAAQPAADFLLQVNFILLLIGYKLSFGLRSFELLGNASALNC